MMSRDGFPMWDYFFPSSTQEQPPPLEEPQRWVLQTHTAGNFAESLMHSEMVPSSLVEIASILRVANEVELSNLRVAYLCRFYAFEKSHRLDPTSSGQGVRQFKVAILQRLERENEISLMSRAEKNDFLQMNSFYIHYYKKYIKAPQNDGSNSDRARLTKAYQTAAILSEVLKAVNETQAREIEEELLGNSGESMIDSEVVPSSLVESASIHRVANEVEDNSNTMVAYL